MNVKQKQVLINYETIIIMGSVQSFIEDIAVHINDSIRSI